MSVMSLWRWYCSRRKPPSEKARQFWQKTKAKGKKSFVLRHGVLGWGGFMFIAMTAQQLIRKPADYPFVIVLNLLIWPIGGYLFGNWMWRYYETYFGEENIPKT